MFQPTQIKSYLRCPKYIPVSIILIITAVVVVVGFNSSSLHVPFYGTDLQNSKLPIIAIANYGSHSSLNAAIAGMQAELAREGFIEHQTIQYAITDVSFDAALIPQMIIKIKNNSPAVIVAMGTPIAQFAKHAIQTIPIVYNVVTDPISTGLIQQATISPAKTTNYGYNHHDTAAEHAINTNVSANVTGISSQQPISAISQNITGSSDQQDLRAMLQFAKQLLPNATRVGLLYSTAESNDNALVNMMLQATTLEHMQLVAIPVDQARDVPMRIHNLRDKVDFIYVGTSGAIQPTLPVIASAANNMRIPVFNVDEGAVKDNLVLASFGVDYTKVGANAGKLVAQILQGIPIAKLQPIYPSLRDHRGFISKIRAKALGITIPETLDVVKF